MAGTRNYCMSTFVFPYFVWISLASLDCVVAFFFFISQTFGTFTTNTLENVEKIEFYRNVGVYYKVARTLLYIQHARTFIDHDKRWTKRWLNWTKKKQTKQNSDNNKKRTRTNLWFINKMRRMKWKWIPILADLFLTTCKLNWYGCYKATLVGKCDDAEQNVTKSKEPSGIESYECLEGNWFNQKL